MYRLNHSEAADDSLTEVWLLLWDMGEDTTPYRAALMRAYDRLQRDAPGEGFHVREGLWRLNEPPLALFFQLDEAERVVTLTDYALLTPPLS